MEVADVGALYSSCCTHKSNSILMFWGFLAVQTVDDCQEPQQERKRVDVFLFSSMRREHTRMYVRPTLYMYSV